MICQNPGPDIEDETYALKKIDWPAFWFNDPSDYEIGIWHEGSRFMQCFNDSKAFKTAGARRGISFPCSTSSDRPSCSFNLTLSFSQPLKY